MHVHNGHYPEKETEGRNAAPKKGKEPVAEDRLSLWPDVERRWGNMTDRPIESYIKEIRRVIGDGETIYLTETYSRKLRKILEEIENKFKVKSEMEG